MSGNNQTRQAANVTVTSQTRRFGSYPAGYQIINQSLAATVWAGDNPSVRSGFGTPISPGTSIVWNTDGELFMCIGDDAQSVAASSAAVVLSYDVSNWQPNPLAVATAILNSGVIIVDQPVLLNNTTLNYLVDPTRGPYDVSRYNSIFVTALNELNQNGYLEIFWYNNASMSQLLAVDHISFVSNGNQSLWQGQIPCRGAYCFLLANNTDIANTLVASNRQVDGIQNTLAYSSGGDYCLLRNEQAIGANAFGNTVYTQPWFGDVDIVVSSFVGGATPTDIVVAVENFSNQQPKVGGDFFMSTNDAQSVASSLGGVLFRSRTQRIGCNGQQLSLVPYNNTATPNVICRIAVMPVLYTKG